MFVLLLLLSLTGEPRKIDCEVLQPVERPGVWDVHVITENSEGKRVHNFVSEHLSRKSALKACDRILTDQEKRWKHAPKSK